LKKKTLILKLDGIELRQFKEKEKKLIERGKLTS